jgi:molecular chaperone HscB
MQNYFELFSLPQVFEIDLGELEKKYLEFQRQFHPDQSSSGDVSRSIEINEAYKVLTDDFLRACYLLLLMDIDIRNDERAVKVDQLTLLQVLELQEKISEISDKNEIEELRKKINLELKEMILDSMKQYKANEIATSAQTLIKAKYLKKIFGRFKNTQAATVIYGNSTNQRTGPSPRKSRAKRSCNRH